MVMGTVRLSYWPFPSIPGQGGEGDTPVESALHAKNTPRTRCDSQSHAQTEHHVTELRGQRKCSAFLKDFSQVSYQFHVCVLLALLSIRSSSIAASLA